MSRHAGRWRPARDQRWAANHNAVAKNDEVVRRFVCRVGLEDQGHRRRTPGIEKKSEAGLPTAVTVPPTLLARADEVIE
jgi:hypothetical protein